MATKSYILYSTSPKMDSSGIKAKQSGAKLVVLNGGFDVATTSRVVTGGTLYQAGLRVQRDFCKDSTVTRPETMKQAVKLVDRGVPVGAAMSLVIPKK